MSEEKTKKLEKVETPAKKTPVEEEPRECNHKGSLRAVSAVEADIPLTVERYHDIFLCKSCGAVVVKDKK